MRILLSGYNGTMGKVVSEVAQDLIVCGYSNVLSSDASFPVYDNLENVVETVDVIIDFSNPKALPALLNYAVARRIPMVIASTGLSDVNHQAIDEASQIIPILQSGNFSLGINVLLDISEKLASALRDFDVEIIEKHHKLKVDAPSGTAIMLQEAVVKARPELTDISYGREGTDTKRSNHEIGMHSIRGGTIVGEHSLIFAGLDEIVEIKHIASSKKIFANGALHAAGFIVRKNNGRYTMEDVIHQ